MVLPLDVDVPLTVKGFDAVIEPHQPTMLVVPPRRPVRMGRPFESRPVTCTMVVSCTVHLTVRELNSTPLAFNTLAYGVAFPPTAIVLG
jgi:hypothetical protein